MPKLGGAFIASVEKLFPEWEAGRMDAAGWSNRATLPFLLPPAFPFFLPSHIYYFTWVITSSSAHGGVGEGRK